MAIRVIVKEPDPILREKSQVVTKFNSNLHKLLDDMADTMFDAGGVGLAAIQVGILKRVIVVHSGEEDAELIEMINPEIISKEGQQFGPEGCLSIPGVSGEVKRYDKLHLKGQDRNGDTFEMDASGFLARIFQHEIDHLDGVLFTDVASQIYDKED
jgi:peptide deformylase